MTIHALTQLSTSEATRLTPEGLHSGMDITIQNTHESGYVYIGGEGVNSEDFGYRLAPGSAWSIELPGQDALYAIGDTPSIYVAILQTGLEG